MVIMDSLGGFAHYPDVCEIFCDGKFVRECGAYGLVGGRVFDLKSGYDFDDEAVQTECEEYLDEHEPWLVIGSPECKAHSQLQNLHEDSPNYAETYNRCLRHLKFCCRMYEKQVTGGRLFLHEHPFGATSWMEQCGQELLGLNNVYDMWGTPEELVVYYGDQCYFQDKPVQIKNEAGYIKKPTGWLTNSKFIGMQLYKHCPQDHEHINLVGYIAHHAE